MNETKRHTSKVFRISVDYRGAKDLHSTASSLKSPSENTTGQRLEKPRTCVCKQTLQNLHHLLASKSGHTLAGVGYSAHRAIAIMAPKTAYAPASRERLPLWLTKI